VLNDKSQGSTAKHLSLGEAGRKSLPKTVVSSDSVTVFKYRIKTFSSPGLSSFFFSVKHCLALATLKLRPYSAVRIRLLLLFLKPSVLNSRG